MRKAFYTKLRFSGCAGLTSVVIPDSVTKIVGDAFRDLIETFAHRCSMQFGKSATNSSVKAKPVI